MLRFRALVAFCAGLLGLALTAAPAEGSILQALDLDELVAQSDRIVVGRVVLAESFQRNDGTIATLYRLEVERQLRGDGPSALDEPEVIIQVLGGRIGDVGMRVEGEPSFAEGERAVVFMKQGTSFAFRPVGMAQGVMRIRMLEGRETVFQSRDGMMLVKRGPDGRLVRSPGALPNRERLQTFLQRVREIARKQASGSDE